MSACHPDLEGSLAAAIYDPEERRALAPHLARCGSCKQELEEFSRVAKLLGTPSSALSESEEQRLVRGVWRASGLLPRKQRSWSAPLAIAAGVLLAVGAGWLWRTPPLRRPDPSPKVAIKPAAPAPAPVEVPRPQPLPEKAPEPQRAVVPPPPPAPLPVKIPVPSPPVPAPVEPPVTPEPPVPVTPPEKKSVVVMATVDRVQGELTLLSESGLTKIQAGQGILPGQELRTSGRSSFASLKVSDGTLFLLSADTVLMFVSDRGTDSSRSFLLKQGVLHADVAKQAAGKPLLINTPNAEARVLGTELSLRVTEAGTRLDVREGKVRLTRREDGAGVDVTAGHAAHAARGVPLLSKVSRVSSGLQALYPFHEGQGGWVHDVSGAGAPLDLRITRPGAVSWSAEGLTLKADTRIDSEFPATRLIDACRKSQELTLEAWVQPARSALDYEGAILALSTDVRDRNFALVQGSLSAGLNLYTASVRTSATDAGGRPELLTAKGTAETRLSHLVFVRTATGVERLYLNGVERASRVKPGTFAPWNDTFRLILANESTEERPWTGLFRLAAIYSRALAPIEVLRNFKAGVE